MSIWRKAFLTLPAGAFAALCAANPAVAGVQASAFIDIADFTITGDVSGLVSTGSADSTIALGDADDSKTGSWSTSAGLDLPVICLGDCPAVNENEFPVIWGSPTATYATADQVESGLPTTGARVSNGSYAGIDTGKNDASSNSNNNVNATWTFDLPESGGITFDFDARAYIEAWVDGLEIVPSFATANYSVVIELNATTPGYPTVFSWIPGLSISGGTPVSIPFTLYGSVSINAPVIPEPYARFGTLGHALGVASSGTFTATTNALAAGQYQLSLRLVTNADISRDEEQDQEQLGCRLTGGAVSESQTLDGEVYYTWVEGTMVDGEEGTNRYQFGGQVGANTALPPQPKGEWQHHQQRGPAGSFSFHGGTASAPAGTEIVEIRCSDPGGCAPSGNPPSPNKQLDFDGIGTFHNMGKNRNAPKWLIDANVTAEGNGNRSFDGTFHWFEVNVDDLGEGPDTDEPNSEACPVEGFGEKGVDVEPANCNCPDFYRITIYDGVDAADVIWKDGGIDPASLDRTNVIYEVRGYTGLGGNGLQLHDLTGFDRK